MIWFIKRDSPLTKKMPFENFTDSIAIEFIRVSIKFTTYSNTVIPKVFLSDEMSTFLISDLFKL